MSSADDSVYRALLIGRLIEAEKAFHQLMIGQGVVEVTDSNGEQVRYTSANAPRLQAYVAALRSQIAGTRDRPSAIHYPHTSKGI